MEKSGRLCREPQFLDLPDAPDIVEPDAAGSEEVLEGFCLHDAFCSVYDSFFPTRPANLNPKDTRMLPLAKSAHKRTRETTGMSGLSS